MQRMNDRNASPIGCVGQLLRIGAGVLLAVSIAPFYLRGEWNFHADTDRDGKTAPSASFIIWSGVNEGLRGTSK